jgi:hypothetical protein
MWHENPRRHAVASSMRVTLLLTVDRNIFDLSNVYTGVIHGR